MVQNRGDSENKQTWLIRALHVPYESVKYSLKLTKLHTINIRLFNFFLMIALHVVISVVWLP